MTKKKKLVEGFVIVMAKNPHKLFYIMRDGYPAFIPIFLTRSGAQNALNLFSYMQDFKVKQLKTFSW